MSVQLPACVAVIPARLGSTRFPRKVLANRTGRTLLQHVYEAAHRASSVARVVVATDSDEVVAAARSFGAEAVMTDASHPNGASRIAQAVDVLGLPCDTIVVNAQGDEPELDPSHIDAAVQAIASAGDAVPVGTVAAPLDASQHSRPEIVKVVRSRAGDALYFSRAPIPHGAAGQPGAGGLLRHIGVYAYRRAFLKTYALLEPSPLERAESLEQLRVLEHGYRIAVAVSEAPAAGGIDTPEQYEAFVVRWCAAQRAS